MRHKYIGDDMILRMPEYCREFRCTADKCSDNCCIGWEIDIDEKTAEYYMSTEGKFGERLRNNISVGDCCSFILKNERCPFLNDNNLCDIILNLGEDKLCHICDNHPRYYEWFDGIVEGGVGMCCEEAARLILENGDTQNYWDRDIPYEEADDYDGELYDFFYEARRKITDYLRDYNRPLKAVVSSVLNYAEIIQYAADNGMTEEVPAIEGYICDDVSSDIKGMLDFFGGLEPIDENWKPYIDGLKKSDCCLSLTKVQEKYIRNIGIYFIWRYFMKGVFDEEILSKVKLAAISMAMAGIMFSADAGADSERCALLVKNYSKEIEYSEENLESIYDITYTSSLFSAEKIVSVFNM